MQPARPPIRCGSRHQAPEGRQELVVVGNGMVGHRFVASMVESGALDRWHVTVFGEEPRPAYDRVGLSSWFAGTSADDLSLVEPGYYEGHGIDARHAEKVVAVDRTRSEVISSGGGELHYDHLVLATGSYPFVPEIPGTGAHGVFVYRTIDDLEAIAAWAHRADVTTGAVIGGGLLGLEAANALLLLGLDTHVVELAPRLMPVQLDDRGSEALRDHVERLGVHVHAGRRVDRVLARDDGRCAGLGLAEHDDLQADLILFSAGVRPRDELARECGLEIGVRGGVAVDLQLSTNDPRISAIGEVALVEDRVHGLVAPGYEMARVLARRLLGDADARFTAAEPSTKLKLLGVDVASFGDAFATRQGSREIVWDDPLNSVYRKLVVSGDGTRILGGMLVGDAGGYSTLVSMASGDLAAPADPTRLLVPGNVLLPGRGGNGAATAGAVDLPKRVVVCSCTGVTKDEISAAIDGGARTIREIKAATGAGSCCGGCVPVVTELLNGRLRASGLEVSQDLCEHFAFSRQELFSLIRVHGYSSFQELLHEHGTGSGCEICKPAMASIFASLSRGHALDRDQAALQDTNDHFLANLQRDGTYSVVPRIPGGEITPDELIVLGEVARDFELYTKITGGQRIDLLGARVEQLPMIWRRLIEAGFESGHAYGKAVRTVKSCVGSTWCRYGVQDSVGMAISIEHRYRGLRAPHKVKMAVSGCGRECAEAMSKDVGVIATENGWNLLVCGNGGQHPRHAALLAENLDSTMLIRYIDRVLMFYIRTADRLERTAAWLAGLEGGIEHLRAVVIDDSLGIAAELEADMQRHVDGYVCEWKATIDDPERLRRFVTFVNAPGAPDPDIVMIQGRDRVRTGRDQDTRSLKGPGVAVLPTEGSDRMTG